MSKLTDKLNKINDYYKKAWDFIYIKDFRSATKVLYEDMPVKLYDTSISILNNRNNTFSNEELKHLINKVDKALCEYSGTSDDIIPEEDLPEETELEIPEIIEPLVIDDEIIDSRIIGVLEEYISKDDVFNELIDDEHA